MTETQADWQSTACILCECNCGIVVQLDGRTLSKIRGDKAHPASQGYTCNKALRLDHYQNNRSRLTSPMRRRPDGSYEEIDWDTVISEIAEGFSRIRDEFGGDKIFYYGGGGQGNHLGGAYSGAFLKALGSRYRSNALAQEKTGEFWVDAQLYGGHTRGEFEHAEDSVFVGKNPWMSQSFPRARTVLQDIAKDPGRSMIVIDPVLTDTAKMADFHLRVRPGTDAWCISALAAVLVQENLCDEAFLAEHVTGVEPVRDALRAVDVDDFAQRCGVDAELLRAAQASVWMVQTNAPYRPQWAGRIPVLRAAFRLLPFLWQLWRAAGRSDLFHVMANSGWSWHLFAAPAIWVAASTGESFSALDASSVNWRVSAPHHCIGSMAPPVGAWAGAAGLLLLRALGAGAGAGAGATSASSSLSSSASSSGAALVTVAALGR